MMIHVIAWREFRNLFVSPLAWTLLAVTQFILAWLFFIQIDTFLSLQPQLSAMKNAPGVTDVVVQQIFGIAGFILLMLCPLITMRSFSEERRTGSLRFLLSSPLSMTDIVIGKYLGVVLFFTLLVALISCMPLSLLVATELDLGKIAAGALGLWLLAAAFSAAGIFISSLTSQPGVAAVGTFGLLLMLWIIDNAANSQDAQSLFRYLSMLQHHVAMLRGVINSSDVAYFLLFIAGFIGLTIRQMDAQRLN